MKAFTPAIAALHRKSFAVAVTIALFAAAGTLSNGRLEAQPCPSGAASPGCASGGGPAPITATLPSCDPRILVTQRPGLIDISGSGLGTTPIIEYTDPNGTLLPASAGTVAWAFRARITEPTGTPRISHDISGYLNLDITTAAGHQIFFRAHCIAGAGTWRAPSFGLEGVTIYANGITTGWPVSPSSPRQGMGARRTFVHFEGYRDSTGQHHVYLALIDGEDCMLNFDVLLWTPEDPYATGSGSFSTAITGNSYTETVCSLLSGPGRSIRGGPIAPRLPKP